MKNLQKYKEELEKLIKKGQELLVAVIYECSPDDSDTALWRAFKMDLDINREEDILPFKEEYQLWYMKARAVVRQLAPDHLENFCAFYQGSGRNYMLVDYLAGIMPDIELEKAPSLFQQQLAIVRAVDSTLTSSLFKIRQLVQADLFDSELDAAKELVNKGFLQAAGVVAGVVMEKHLAQVCENRKIKFPRKPTINDFNKYLEKNGEIDVPQSKFIQYLGSIRNSCAHNNKGEEASKEQVEKLIGGVAELIKTLS